MGSVDRAARALERADEAFGALRRRRARRPPVGGDPRASPPRATTRRGGDGLRCGSATSYRQRARQPDRRPGVVRPGPAARRPTSRRASSRDGWRSPRWAATSTTRPSCWPRPSWPSTGPAASVTSTWRPRRSPTAAWPTCSRAASTEGMALLDEAMALACGPADDVDTAGRVGVLVLHRLLPRRRLRAGRRRGPSCCAATG